MFCVFEALTLNLHVNLLITGRARPLARFGNDAVFKNSRIARQPFDDFGNLGVFDPRDTRQGFESTTSFPNISYYTQTFFVFVFAALTLNLHVNLLITGLARPAARFGTDAVFNHSRIATQPFDDFGNLGVFDPHDTRQAFESTTIFLCALIH